MLGRKTGSGFYKYEGKTQSPNEKVEEWRRPERSGTERDAVEKSHGAVENREGEAAKSTETGLSEISREPSTPLRSAQNDTALRLVYLMVNEAARCLEERVVATPEDADYGMILGTGFAPLRGGPLRFADHFGVANLVAAVDSLGEKYQPCALLRQHANNGTKFYENTARSA
jgi:3-hydroxyacyl-CoA dehydrogenase